MSKNNPVYMMEVSAIKNDDGGFETLVTVCRENSFALHYGPSPRWLSWLETYVWAKVIGLDKDRYDIEPTAGPEQVGFTVHIGPEA